MSKITVLGVDPAFRNMGFARAVVDLETGEMTAESISLVSTEKTSHKQVRISSDNLSRARVLFEALTLQQTGCALMIAEIPSGAQSAKAAYGFGVAVGVCASHRIPMIEVTPTEVKKTTTGYGDASKADMIEWATTTFPHLPWVKGRGTKKWADANEHMADALAIIFTGIRTQQFLATTAVLRAVAAE